MRFDPAAKEAAQKIASERAWLLDLGNNHWAAVPLHEMSQIILSPELFELPLTPSHCHQLMLFQKHILPVINIATLITGSSLTDSSGKIVGLTVYQKAPKKPLEYAAIHLANMPFMVRVEDAHMTSLPDNNDFWPLFSMSCFQYEERKVPVLDLAALYSAEVAAAAYERQYT